MKTKPQNLNSLAQSAPVRIGLMALGFATLAFVPPASADVRVGVSVGLPIPNGYAEVRVGRDRYYEHHGVFYRPGPRGYMVVRAPRGAIIRVLPPHYTRIYVGSDIFYRYGDVYYREANGGYVVVDAPVSASLPPAPPADDYQSVWVGKSEYLLKGGQFFVKTPEGVVWTQAPVGALVRDLPADARSVWYQKEEYFESDDVYFHKTPDGYEIVAAPWKK